MMIKKALPWFGEAGAMIANRDTAYRDELARLTPGLRRFARALVEDHKAEAADDLVQASLVAALAGDQDLRGTRLQMWMLSRVATLHRMQVRDAGAGQTAVARQGGGPGQGVRTSHWELPRKARSRDVALFEDLPLESREVLLLVALERLTYVQVAECLGLTLNAVFGHLARAREHLSRTAQVREERRQGGAGTGAPHKRAVPYLRLVK